MSDDPYRPSPAEPNAELAKLAAEGNARMRAAKPAKPVLAPDPKADELRAALGDLYFSPVRVAALSAVALGLLLVVVAAVAWSATGESLGAAIGFSGLVLLFAGLIASSTEAAQRATPAQVDAERRWVGALPFRLEGYLEALEHEPEVQCRLDFALEWASAAAMPSDDIVLGVWGTQDTGARIEGRSGDTVRVRSGPIVSPATQLRVLTIYRNTRIPPFVHRLVDRVLVPMHRSHPLARVSIQRF
jgi:hypothetical protein